MEDFSKGIRHNDWHWRKKKDTR